MVCFPHCKINLGLSVVSKRQDGYHNIETCFFPIPFTDILEIIPSTKLTFQASGIKLPGPPGENLCIKAYKCLQQEFKLPPVSIHLHKKIPVGGGLGGGSSDAAFTLKLLNEIFTLELSPSTLRHYALTLGSDCPFFFEDQPCLGTGRGEILEPLEIHLKNYFLILLNPGIHVSTSMAFQHLILDKSGKSIKQILENFPPSQWKSVLKNDFEPFVLKKFPEIASLKKKLMDAGALYASMTGTGSSVFGVFEELDENTFSNYGDAFLWSGKLDFPSTHSFH